MAEVQNPNAVPVGLGGIPGRIVRMIVMVCSGGFLFPNAFIEGLDCTAIQKETQGTLYNKK